MQLKQYSLIFPNHAIASHTRILPKHFYFFTSFRYGILLQTETIKTANYTCSAIKPTKQHAYGHIMVYAGPDVSSSLFS